VAVGAVGADVVRPDPAPHDVATRTVAKASPLRMVMHGPYVAGCPWRLYLIIPIKFIEMMD